MTRTPVVTSPGKFGPVILQGRRVWRISCAYVSTMKTKPSVSIRVPSLVAVPPPPEVRLHYTRPLAESSGRSRAVSSARVSQGKTGRSAIRREEPRRTAPRATGRTMERGNQPRTHKAGQG